jgi:Fe-S-cluster containining protein
MHPEPPAPPSAAAPEATGNGAIGLAGILHRRGPDAPHPTPASTAAIARDGHVAAAAHETVAEMAPTLPALLPKPAPTDSLCDHCAALCCRYVALPIDNPTDVRDYDNIRWYLLHENIVVFVESRQWYVSFLTRCKQLRPDNRCGIYLTRPRICRGYDTDNCDYHGGEYGYELLFTSADQLLTWYEKKFKKPLVIQPTKKPRAKVKRRNGKKRVELPVV